MNDFPKMNMTRMRFLLLVESLLLLATPSRCQDENTIIERPVDYVDDVYHCEDPQLVYDFVGNTNDTISCDPITWKWNVEELDVSEPPFICEGVENLQTLQEQTPVVDWLEPCILWGMIHGDFTPEGSNTIPDDVYHCRDVSSVRENSISCDSTTLEWNLDELSSNRPPGLCSRDFTIMPDEVPNVQDWFEPCVLWAMVYGNLRPTSSPTAAPTKTIAPTVSSTEFKTLEPTPPFTGVIRVPTPISDESSNVVVLEPIVLTLVWSSNAVQDQNLSVDRMELRTLTERHVLEGLQAELGLTLVTAVNLILTSGLPTSKSFTETVTGTVSLNARIPSLTVQRLVESSFQSNALELYQFRLKISTDPALKQVQSVIVGTNIDFDSITADSTDTEEPEEKVLDTVMIAVISSVGAALVAVCCFGCCILYLSRRRLAKAQAARMVKGSYKSSVASSSKASQSRSGHHLIPPVPTKSLSQEDYPPIYEEYEEDEENQMSLISMSEMDEQSHIAPDEQSITTSVYSYFNHDDSSVIGGASVASSFFHSIEGPTPTNEVNSQRKKGFMWSVMDTMQKHFGTDSEREDEQSPRSSMLGPSVRDEDSDQASTNSGSLLYETKEPPKIETKSSVDEEEVEDFDAEISPQATTPVRERFERMWREEDEEQESSDSKKVGKEENSAPTKLETLEPTLKEDDLPPKPKSILVFQDDNSGNNSNSNSVNDSCQTDESPVPSILLESSNVRSAPVDEEVPIKEVTRIVNRIPDDQDDEELDDDDQKMALLLPSQLKAADPNFDNSSQSSSLSSRSNVSGRSKGSQRNTFGVAALMARSVRVKRENSWGKLSTSSKDTPSVNSTHSTDSAKYRSLLNQGDTNDAALFGLKNDDKSDDNETAVSPDSALKATRLNYDQDQVATENKREPRAQLSNLIKSFDEVWSKEESDQVSSNDGQPTRASDAQDDSDEEDIYVEANDDDDSDDDDGNNQSDNDSIKSGASRAVQGLSSLLISSNKETQESTTSGADMSNGVERRLSFEIQDSSDDESEEEKKDDYTLEMEAVNMERMRRLSLAGYAETMASF